MKGRKGVGNEKRSHIESNIHQEKRGPKGNDNLGGDKEDER